MVNFLNRQLKQIDCLEKKNNYNDCFVEFIIYVEIKHIIAIVQRATGEVEIENHKSFMLHMK